MIIDYHAFIYGRNWRLKNRSEFFCNNCFDVNENEYLWMSWNIGCNTVNFIMPVPDCQGVLF